MVDKNAVLKRDEVSEEYKWRLEDIYETDELWEEDHKRVKSMLPKVESFKGTIGESPSKLLQCLLVKDDISRLIEKLYVYSHMRRDEDNGKSKYQALADRAESLNVEVHEKLSFIVPEILMLPEKKIDEYIKKEEGLKVYRHYIDEVLRVKEHVLSPEQERIISMAGDIANTPGTVRRMLSNADMKFPKVLNDDGDEVELSEGRYYQLIRSGNRDVRKGAFEGLYSTYKKYSNTFSATLSGAVKADIFHSKVRKYGSALKAALYEDNIPLAVYDNVVNVINRNLGSLHRYMNIKKKMLCIDELHMYDLYAPIVENTNKNIPYEEGVEMVIKGLMPLGYEYINLLKEGFESGWIDVFENEGKSNGAYSWGMYDTNPYVLLNYSNTLSDVSTIAHEMGHSIHSLFSRKSQPYIYSDYTLFCAEVASTTNEALLTDYLLSTTKDKKMRIYIINQQLEEIRTTVYRQAMFAEFEKIIHERVENGEALTSDYICSLWHQLNTKFHGPDVVIDDYINMEWSRIGHFYRNFYVYKYVTGYAAAMSISQRILNEGTKAVDGYFEFLKGGSSDYSINLLKRAGVDMTTPEPLENTIKIFEKLLDELEAELT